AAAQAGVAWAVTDHHGSLVQANASYRRLAGSHDSEAPPPEHALAGDDAAAALYRLSRKARARESHEETFRGADGVEFAGSVRPMSDGCTAWWLVPQSPSRGASPLQARSDAAPANFFEHAPVGLALVEQDGTLVEANALFCEFFDVMGNSSGRALSE